MALDKIVDSSVLDAGLKTIADAIREKGGTSSALAFPGGMAEAIAAIQAGGGGGGNIVYGTFTPAENIRTLTVEHGLGKLPSFAMFFVRNATSADDNAMYCAGGITNTSYFRYAKTSSYQITIKSRSNALTSETTSSNPCPIGSMTADSMVLGTVTNYYLLGGIEYMWLVMP